MAPKKKLVPDAPRATYTLRDFRVEDWRWPIPEGTKIYMRRRVSVGMPEEMREMIEAQRDTTGFSMSEIGRRAFMRALASEVKSGRR